MCRVVGRCGPRHRSVQTRSPSTQVVVHRQLGSAADLDGLLITSSALEADELELVRLAGQLLAGVVVGDGAAGEPLPRLDDLLHPLLDGLEVLGRERPLDAEVVVEAVLDRRPDAQQRAGEQVLHGLRHHVGGRVAQDRPAVGGCRWRPARRRHRRQGVRQVLELAADPRGDHLRRVGLGPAGRRRWCRP